MSRLFILILLLHQDAHAQDDIVRSWAQKYHSAPRSATAEKGDIVTSYGLRIDRSCQTGLGAEGRTLIKRKSEDALTEAFSRIRDFIATYRIEPYMHKIVAVMTSATVVCVPAKAYTNFSGLQPTALAYTVTQRLGTGPGAPPRIKRDTRRLKAVGLPADFDRLYYIVLPQGAFEKRDYTELADYYFHEAAHHSGMDNRWSHRNNALKEFNLANLCEENRYDDRIMFFEGIMGFEDRERFKDGVTLRYRIERCGLERACVLPLTKVDSIAMMPKDEKPDAPLWLMNDWHPAWANIRHGLHELGKPWNVEEARLFCDRIAANWTVKDQDEQTRRNKEIRYAKSLQYIFVFSGGLTGQFEDRYFAYADRETKIALAASPRVMTDIRINCAIFEDVYGAGLPPQKRLLTID
ncbi:MAG: hypothetical protein AABZ44_01175, partial [Elusimicrobiota bacterium]